MEKEKLFEVGDDNDTPQYGINDCEKSCNAVVKSEDEYTFEEAVEHFGFGRFQFRLMFSVGLTLIADAALLLSTSILGNALECTSWKLSKVKVAWLTTIVFLGMIVFSPFIGWLIDRFGRKLGILMTLVVGSIFAALGSFSPSYPWLLASRFLVGAALAGSMQVFGYIEEFLSINHRRWAMLVELFFPFGGLWAASFGLLMIHDLKLSWTWYLFVMSVPLILTILFMVCLPESARFLAMLGKFQKIDKILARIGKENKTGLPRGNFSRESLSKSFQEDSDESEKVLSDSFKNLFIGVHCKSTTILSALWFVAGFVYYGLVILVTTYNSRKQPSKDCVPMSVDDYTNLIWTAFAEVPGIIITVFVLEKIGRKKTMIAQLCIISISLVPFFFSLPNPVFIGSLVVSRATAQGFIAALVIYTPEVYPTALRGKSIGITNFFFRLGGMLTPFFSQVTVHDYFDLTIGVYLGVCCLAALLSFFLPKETQGMPLEN